MTGETEQPIIWAIRYTQQATYDIFTAWRYFAEVAGDDIADAWESGLKAEIAKMAQYPRRFSVEEGVFSTPTRRLLYRRTKRGPAYHLYFTLQTVSEDAPTALILHLRHAAQAPLTREEVRQIESNR